MFRNNGIGGGGGGAFAFGGGATGGGGSAAAVPAGGAPCLAGGGAAVPVSAFATGCSTLPNATFGTSGHGGPFGLTDPLSHASESCARFACPGKAVGLLSGAWLLLAGILLDLLCPACDG
jgi:hypothetical protein